MHYRAIARVIGSMLMLFSIVQVVPLLLSIWLRDGAHAQFVMAAAITATLGFFLWLLSGNKPLSVGLRDGFMITALFWIITSLCGALPLLIGRVPDMSVTDAIFESVSGLTTTGATVLTGLDTLPESVLLYRHLLQWLGGIGIIVIAVAILPILGIGGLQMYRAETPGPIKNHQLAARITQSAKMLSLVYFWLTACCGVAYWLAGMSPLDAVCHSMSTVSIGGFSTHDASMAWFDSSPILMICALFMIISGINFTLHFFTWQRRGQLAHYLKDPESASYLMLLAILVPGTCLLLILLADFKQPDELLKGAFQAVSLFTTTGYTVTNFSSWPTLVPFLLMTTAFIGGCAGSTSGGIKVIRVLIAFKQGMRELRQLIHPQAVLTLSVGHRSLPPRVVNAVWSFIALYALTFLTLLMCALATGLDFLTAFYAVAAVINNLGPGLGAVASHYGDIGDASKWVLCAGMLLGRLEVFTLLVLLTPEFWRR